jgi:hypothetical protein
MTLYNRNRIGRPVRFSRNRAGSLANVRRFAKANEQEDSFASSVWHRPDGRYIYRGAGRIPGGPKFNADATWNGNASNVVVNIATAGGDFVTRVPLGSAASIQDDAEYINAVNDLLDSYIADEMEDEFNSEDVSVRSDVTAASRRRR